QRARGLRPAGRYRRRLPVARHRQGPGSADNEGDVFGVVVQLDAGGIAVGRRALVIWWSRALQCKGVVRQCRREGEVGLSLVVYAASGVVDHLADTEICL